MFRLTLKATPPEEFDSTKQILVCIPAYNEEKAIGEVVRSAKLFASEVIVCDDGSTDRTAEEAKQAGAVVLSHSLNKGYGAAVKTMFNFAKDQNADVMVTLDSDGQHDPAQIPSLVEPILRCEADIVIGSRFLNKEDRKKIPAIRSFGIQTITKLSQLTSSHNLTDGQSGFRAYGKKAISSISLNEDGMAVSTEILMRARQKDLVIREVPITVRYDLDDTSTHNPILHGGNIVLTMLRYLSIYHPLKFYGLPGLGFFVIAAVFAAQAIDLFSHTRYVSTPMIIISVGSAVIGAMLMITAVILFTLSALLKEKMRNP